MTKAVFIWFLAIFSPGQSVAPAIRRPSLIEIQKPVKPLNESNQSLARHIPSRRRDDLWLFVRHSTRNYYHIACVYLFVANIGKSWPWTVWKAIEMLVTFLRHTSLHISAVSVVTMSVNRMPRSKVKSGYLSLMNERWLEEEVRRGLNAEGMCEGRIVVVFFFGFSHFALLPELLCCRIWPCDNWFLDFFFFVKWRFRSNLMKEGCNGFTCVVYVIILRRIY